MNAKKKILSFIVCAAVIMTTACSGDSGGNSNNAGGTAPAPAASTTENLDNKIDYNSMADIGEVDEKNEDGTGPAYEKGKLAGEVKALCYYDVGNESKDISELFATRFGGTLTTEVAGWSEWWDKLGTYVATGN